MLDPIQEMFERNRLRFVRKPGTITKKIAENCRKCAKQRRARGVKYTKWEHVKARWDYYAGGCYLCGKPADTLDHVIPIARGGTHFPANLRPSCRTCNSRKGAKALNETSLHQILSARLAS